MAKEVSDRIIVIFIIIAVVVSVLGTFFVYTQSSIKYKSPYSDTQQPSSVGYVGIKVIPPENKMNDKGVP